MNQDVSKLLKRLKKDVIVLSDNISDLVSHTAHETIPKAAKEFGHTAHQHFEDLSKVGRRKAQQHYDDLGKVGRRAQHYFQGSPPEHHAKSWIGIALVLGMVAGGICVMRKKMAQEAKSEAESFGGEPVYPTHPDPEADPAARI